MALSAEMKARRERLGIHPPRPVVQAPAAPSEPERVAPSAPAYLPNRDNFSVTHAILTPIPEAAKRVKIKEFAGSNGTLPIIEDERMSNRQKAIAAYRLRIAMRNAVEAQLEVILEDVVRNAPSREVTVASMKSDDRSLVISAARSLFYYRAVTETAGSFAQIALAVNRINHTTAIYGAARYAYVRGLPMPRGINGDRIHKRATKKIKPGWGQGYVPLVPGREGYPQAPEQASEPLPVAAIGSENGGTHHE